MASPASLLAPRFEAALAAAFGAEHAGTDPALRRSDRADYQADVALGLARKLKRAPRDVAQALVEHLDVADMCESVDIAGPGFINLTLKATFLSERITEDAADDRLGVALASSPEVVVVDYSSPNTAKEMHVGHLRSTIIGDCLARVLAFLGHRVVRQNHLGDWGTPFGMLIEHLLDLGDTGEESSISDLNEFYRQAREKFDQDPAFAERARQRVVSLQAGDAATLELWQRLLDQSRRHIEAVYARLGIGLSDADIRGESFYNPELPGVVAELDAKGLLTTSDGARCVFPEGFSNKDGSPLPLIVQKKDGGFGYAATDLAAIRFRTVALGATRILYVVGAPQQQHFAMVFAVAKAAGWVAPPARAEHVAFGSILGPDKKMFKTRSGETVKLMGLLDEAVERARAVIAERELDDATREEVARSVGIGAIKYADLSSDRIKDYVFDWNRMLSFDGNTAPYLQYAHARIRSIFRKAEADGDAVAAESAPIVIAEPAERALALELFGFGGAALAVADSLQPHRLCTYLYNLATTFTAFYEKCPVLRADDPAVRHSRLRLCEHTARTLSLGLGLLGIDAPEQM